MLKEENDLLTQIGPGTPMGQLFRQYWIPAVLSTELPEGDCPPVRIRLLGENLIAFRDTEGRPGVLGSNCPHRGASLFFGRNEANGLRCVYHGWKFDVTGRCVDQPNEPPETNFAERIRHLAYPCQERGGVIWTYMGPRTEPPPLPIIEGNMHSGEECRPWTAQRECSWLQGLEGDIDTSHAAFLHSRLSSRFSSMPGTHGYYSERTKQPRPIVEERPYGMLYANRRPAEDDSWLWSIGQFLLPFYTMVNSIDLGVQYVTRAWVPIDDEHVMFWYFWWAPEGLREADPDRAKFSYMRDVEYLPNTTEWLGRWHLAANTTNEYQMDREIQRTENFTGMAAIHTQDQAMTESMGAIQNRTEEHIGPADTTIVTTRGILLRAARGFAEGIVPPTVDNPDLYATRSGRIVLPRDADWIEATEHMRRAFTDVPEGVAAPSLA